MFSRAVTRRPAELVIVRRSMETRVAATAWPKTAVASFEEPWVRVSSVPVDSGPSASVPSASVPSALEQLGVDPSANRQAAVTASWRCCKRGCGNVAENTNDSSKSKAQYCMVAETLFAPSTSVTWSWNQVTSALCSAERPGFRTETLAAEIHCLIRSSLSRNSYQDTRCPGSFPRPACIRCPASGFPYRSYRRIQYPSRVFPSSASAWPV